MKNFETRCPIDGTSALLPQLDAVPQAATIIEFPGQVRQDTFALNLSSQGAVREYVREKGVVRTLRDGSLAGCSYHRMKTWQAALAGCAFTLFSLVSILAGL